MRWRVSRSPPANPKPCVLGVLLGCGRGVFELPGAVEELWQRLAALTASPRSPHPRCLHSTCAGHRPAAVSWKNQTSPCPSPSRVEVQHLHTSGWWRQGCGKLPRLAQKSRDEHSWCGSPALLGGRDRPRTEGWEQKARNLWNHTLNRLWECKSKPWYKLNWCSYCVQVNLLIFELPKASKDYYVR